MKCILKITALLFLLISTNSIAIEKAFYILHSKKMEALLATMAPHVSSINILISQAYHIDQHGIVTGFISPDLLDFTQKYSIKLMAMITNSSFDEEKIHAFLGNVPAQKKALHAILTLCQENPVYGVQFDFEIVPLKDKNKLTHFYHAAAQLFHQHGLIVSFAVAPVITDGPFASTYLKRKYANVGGAYDLTALGKDADFITLMAYDQHFGRVTPGPVASMRWAEEIIKHALQYIPAQKISLGIPTYSGFWYTGTHPDNAYKIMIQNDSISYQTASNLIKKHHATLQWNDADNIHYAIYEHNWLNEYIFMEDAESFAAKLKLVKKHHLRGFSLFRIGTEDPTIWKSIRLCKRITSPFTEP